MLLRGETKNADQIAKEMNDIRNRAMHSSYVDLVMDKSQVPQKMKIAFLDIGVRGQIQVGTKRRRNFG